MDFREWLAYRLLRVKPREVVVKGSPLAAATTGPGDTYGLGQDWSPTTYGEYYARSVLIYKAVSLRAQSITRPPLRIYETTGEETTEVSPEHPLRVLLDYVNGWWPKARLWEATSTYLDLWGSAFWVMPRGAQTARGFGAHPVKAIRQPTGAGNLPTEIWPARPDKMRIVPSRRNYIEGFIYTDRGASIPFTPDEVLWFSRFNPLSEYAGLSPVAPVRLSADMGMDAMKYNRMAFKGMLHSNLDIQIDGTVTDEQVEDFNKRLRERYASAEKSHEPLIHGSGWKASNLGFSQREMEYLGTLRWTLEDVSRAFDIPAIMLGDLTHSTYANVDAAERIYWRGIATYLNFLSGPVTEFLCPLFGDGLSAAFDLSEIEALQADVNAIREQDRADVVAGIRTINEVRADRGDDPVTWGDDFWAPMTQVPIGSGSAESMASTLAMLQGNGHHAIKRYVPVALTAANLDKSSDAYIKRLTPMETDFNRLQRELFNEQLKETLRRLRAAKSVKQIGSPLFDVTAWLSLYISRGRPLMQTALTINAISQVSEFGLGVAFDVKNPIVQSWLDERAKFWSKRVNEETGRLITQEMAAGLDNGESIKQLQERVEKVFRYNDQVRSEMIARTEMVSATNKGALEAYRQSGMVEKKMWVATQDERTREDHAAAHMQVVPLDSPFIVGGEQMMGPGQDGSAGQIINCRCTVAPVVSSGARSIAKRGGASGIHEHTAAS